MTLTGPRPWERIDEYYAMGDVFASCSHSETQGLTYIEAMASGLCVAAADDPCLDGVIEDGVNGLLAGKDDASVLHTLLRAFGPEGEQVRRQAVAASARFSVQAFAEAIDQSYHSAIEARVKKLGNGEKRQIRTLAIRYRATHIGGRRRGSGKTGIRFRRRR